MIKKKGQEEIVGFVLIVVIASIILLVFLVILLRNNGVEGYKESKEVNEFIQSSMEYTSDCAINYEPNYLKVGELIRECKTGSVCLSGQMACDSLNKTFVDLIGATWQIGENRPIKGYLVNSSYFGRNETNGQNIIEIYAGNCTGSSVKGAEDIAPDYPGNIITRIELCY